jgi:enterochelin esterase family protein
MGLLLVAAGSSRGEGAGERKPLSPRLAALARDLGAGKREALAAFWQEVQGKAPLVEGTPGDDKHRLVTFVWRGDDKASGVALMGGFASPDPAKPLVRLGDTDLWYLTETHPTDARFGYLFVLNGPTAPSSDVAGLMRAMRQGQLRPDPLNPLTFGGQSVVELPDAPPQPWVRQQSGITHGQMTQTTLKSEGLKAEYPLTVYTPPGYDANRDRCWLLVAFDGGLPATETTLDNLLAAGRIPPVVVVGVGNLSQESRDRDLGGSEAFGRFLADELVPWARKTYRLYPDASHTIVGGVSLGGFMALYCGLEQPKTFGKVLALSPTLLMAPGQKEPQDPWTEEAPGMLAQQYASARRRPLQIHLEVGRYETYYLASLLSQARRLRDVLRAKGYRVTYSEFAGGHSEVCWRGSFANGLLSLTAKRARGRTGIGSPAR